MVNFVFTPATEKRIFFTKWLFFTRCLNSILNDPAKKQIKEAYEKETRGDIKASIVLNDIYVNNVNTWSKIRSFHAIKDILKCSSTSEYLNQFN